MLAKRNFRFVPGAFSFFSSSASSSSSCDCSGCAPRWERDEREFSRWTTGPATSRGLLAHTRKWVSSEPTEARSAAGNCSLRFLATCVLATRLKLTRFLASLLACLLASREPVPASVYIHASRDRRCLALSFVHPPVRASVRSLASQQARC